jgi:hypothetical protein
MARFITKTELNQLTKLARVIATGELDFSIQQKVNTAAIERNVIFVFNTYFFRHVIKRNEQKQIKLFVSSRGVFILLW